MRVIFARNVNDAWRQGRGLITGAGVRGTSRNGDVWVMDGPVTTVYERPTERVLFDEARDANPFFHFFECLWMLSGSNDPAFLNLFVRDFGSRFAEPANGLLYGAYGARWRTAFHGMDQLDIAVRRLRAKPDDRRTVLAMWGTGSDLWDPEDLQEGEQEPRDLPCNTHIYLGIRRELIAAHYNSSTADPEYRSVLDMTVCCRSNDIVWGAYGANAVHFSFLQEYLAGRIDVQVGTMYQMSNNYHAYVNVMKRYVDKKQYAIEDLSRPLGDPYAQGRVSPAPIGTNWEAWDVDLTRFMEYAQGGAHSMSYRNGWFHEVAERMWKAHECWRNKDSSGAMFWVDQVAAPDWRLAARAWLERRINKTEAA